MNYGKLFRLVCLIILSVGLLLNSSCKEGMAEPHLSVLTTDNLQKLQFAADKIITEYNAPGLAAYISVEGEGELFITRGVSNLATSEPMNFANHWRIASVTKTFTTEAILILADRGKIDLNKSISSYLPELKIPSGDRITIRMLGNMTSGLFNYSEDTLFLAQLYKSVGERIFTPEELIAASFKHPLNFIPGTKYEYCNTNTIILGLLIKKVTGQTLSQVFSEQIFRPLGMTNTSWPISRFLPYPYSHGYTNKIGLLIDVTNWTPSWGDAAGQLVSNFADLKKWVKEIYEGNLLSVAAKNERFKWVDEDGKGILFYGFGLMKKSGWIGHSGIIEGYNSQVYYHPEKKITLIVYTNCDDDTPAMKAVNEFVSILLQL